MLEIENVYKSYGSVSVIHRMSLRVERGNSLCVVGPSGCGKTTLLKIIALIIQPDRGAVAIDGVNTNSATPSQLEGLRTAISYSFQEPLLLPYLNALDNITLILSRSTETDHSELRGRATATLSRLGLHHRLKHPPTKLSVGEKKRVDLARALVRRTTNLVADEPLANLDPDSQGLVMDELKHYVKNGGTVIYSSVDPSETRYANNTFQMMTGQSERPITTS